MIPSDNIKQGLECCLVGNCKPCPYYTIPDRSRCRAALYDNAIDYFEQLDEIRKERDELADKVYELEEKLGD